MRRPRSPRTPARLAIALGLLSSLAGTAASAQVRVAEVLFLDGFEPPEVPLPGDLRVNEVMPDPALPLDDATAEWVEIVNAAAQTRVLDGCTLQDASAAVASLAGLALAPGELAVGVRSSDPDLNGGIAWAFTFGFAINNGVETVAIHCGVVVHQIGYTTSMAGRSIMIEPDGTQCSADTSTPLYAPNNHGTPGFINVCP
jgi:hypothetical protein